MGQYERKCIMCDATYQYCNHCDRFDHLPKWMVMFDKQECKNVFDIISNYRSNVITKFEAQKQLGILDLSDIHFNPTVQKSIDEIMSIDNSELKMVTDIVEEAENIIVETEEVAKGFSEEKPVKKTRKPAKMKPAASTKIEKNEEPEA